MAQWDALKFCLETPYVGCFRFRCFLEVWKKGQYFLLSLLVCNCKGKFGNVCTTLASKANGYEFQSENELALIDLISYVYIDYDR